MLPLVTLTIRAIDSFGGRQETMVKSRSKEMKDGALLEVVYIFEGASKADVVDYYRCQTDADKIFCQHRGNPPLCFGCKFMNARLIERLSQICENFLHKVSILFGKNRPQIDPKTIIRRVTKD